LTELGSPVIEAAADDATAAAAVPDALAVDDAAADEAADDAAALVVPDELLPDEQAASARPAAASPAMSLSPAARRTMDLPFLLLAFAVAAPDGTGDSAEWASSEVTRGYAGRAREDLPP
jgi:hypothetical protein